MTTPSTTAPMTLDVSQTARVPFSRLVSVELRKMFDTRAGRWLLISIAASTALVLVIQLWVVLAQDLTVTLQRLRGWRQHPDDHPAAGSRHHVGDQRVEPAHGDGDLHPRAVAQPLPRREVREHR